MNNEAFMNYDPNTTTFPGTCNATDNNWYMGQPPLLVNTIECVLTNPPTDTGWLHLIVFIFLWKIIASDHVIIFNIHSLIFNEYLFDLALPIFQHTSPFCSLFSFIIVAIRVLIMCCSKSHRSSFSLIVNLPSAVQVHSFPVQIKERKSSHIERFLTAELIGLNRDLDSNSIYSSCKLIYKTAYNTCKSTYKDCISISSLTNFQNRFQGL